MRGRLGAIIALVCLALTIPASAETPPTISSVQFRGHHRVSKTRLRAAIRTRPGQPLDHQRVRDDVRALWRLKELSDVRVSFERGGAEVRVIFEVTEHRALRDLVIRGANPLGERAVRRLLALSFGDLLVPTTVKARAQRVEDELSKLGHFKASVKTYIQPRGARSARLAVIISAGPRPLIRHLRLRGNKSIRATRLLALVRTLGGKVNTRGGIFRTDMLADDISRMMALYFEHGFVTLAVEAPDIRLTKNRQIVDVQLTMREGPQFRFGRIRVAGASKPKAGLQSRQGDIFRRSRVAADMALLTAEARRLGRRVSVTPLTRIDLKQRTVDVDLEVEAAKP